MSFVGDLTQSQMQTNERELYRSSDQSTWWMSFRGQKCNTNMKRSLILQLKLALNYISMFCSLLE
jgi:hypothetical protein